MYTFILCCIYYILGNVQIKNGRGLWHTLFCCFGKSRSRKNSSFDHNSGINATNNKSEGSFTPPVSPDLSQSSYLLPAIRHQDMHKKCMVIDLDETLVHSSFKASKTCSLCILLYFKQRNKIIIFKMCFINVILIL